MNAGQLRNMIVDKSDNHLFVCLLGEISEANRILFENNIIGEITENEWEQIVTGMNTDALLLKEFEDSLRYHTIKVIHKTREG